MGGKNDMDLTTLIPYYPLDQPHFSPCLLATPGPPRCVVARWRTRRCSERWLRARWLTAGARNSERERS